MFDVGEILYLLSNKNHKIVPAMVEAVTTVKKVDGTEVSHEISVPGYEKKVVLEKLNVKSFKDIHDLRKHVMTVLEQKIDEDIKEVILLAQESWDISLQNQERNVDHLRPDISTLNSIQEIELEDGVKARVHLPRDLM